MTRLMLPFALLLLTCNITLTIQGNAQNVLHEYDTGAIYEDRATRQLQSIGTVDQHHYYLHIPGHQLQGSHRRARNKKVFVSIHDEALQMVTKQEISLAPQRKRVLVQGAYFLAGKLTVISSAVDKPGQICRLYATELHTGTLEPIGETRLVAEYSMGEGVNMGFKVAVSPDTRKVMVFATQYGRHNEPLQHTVDVFNDVMVRQWTSGWLPGRLHHTGYLRRETFRICDQGDVYLMGRAYDNIHGFRNKAGVHRSKPVNEWLLVDYPNYRYMIYRFTSDDPQGRFAVLQLPEYFIRSLNFRIGENNEVLCYGLYSRQGMVSPEGVFTFRFNLHTARIRDLAIFEALEPGEYLVGNEVTRLQNALGNLREWDPFDYTISELHARSNGDLYFIAEQTLRSRRHATVHLNKDLTSFLFKHDLLIVNLQATGEGDQQEDSITIQRVVKTQQIPAWFPFGSYGMMELGDDLLFFYNEIPATSRISRRSRVGEMILAHVPYDGVVSYTKVGEELFGHSKPVLPETIRVIDTGVFTFGTHSLIGKSHRFGKLSVKISSK